MDFDEIFRYISSFGLYQKCIVHIFCLPLCLASGFHMFNVIFMSNTPNFWCRIEELKDMNVNLRQNLSLSISSDISEAQCKRSPSNYSSLLVENHTNLNETLISCTNWEYDDSQYKSTIISDWNLFCPSIMDYQVIVLTVMNVGGLIGAFVFGYIQDRFGRRKCLALSLFIQLVFGVVTAFAPEFISFCVFRFFTSMEILPIMEASYTLSIEWVGPDKRTLPSVMINVYYSLGALISIVLAYFVRSWSTYALTTSVPLALLLISCWFLPESPRWLLSKNKIAEAEVLLRKAAAVNKRILPMDFNSILKDINRSESSAENEDKSYGLVDLFRTPNLRMKSFVMFYIWFSTGIGYMGLSYYASDLVGSVYWNFMLSIAIEIPSYVVMGPITAKWGRRWPCAITLIITGIVCFVLIGISDMPIASLVVFLIGKFSIASIFVSLFAFTGETFPTVVRGIGSGVSLLMQYLGYIIASQKDTMMAASTNLPLIFFGVVTLIGGCLGMYLPETLNKPLPQILEDGENFGKYRSLKEFFQCCPTSSAESNATQLGGSVSTIPMSSTQNLVHTSKSSINQNYM